MFFNNPFRPEPKFQPGQLVFLPDDAVRYKENRYLLIERRRWVKPQDMPSKRWIYDGIIFQIEGSELVFFTTTTCDLEESLRPIPGLR